MKAREISAKLAERAEEVCLHLFPQGHRKGHEFAIGSLSGDRGDSLKVRLDGEKSGLWSDFATGEKGDMIDLWRLSQGKTFIEAMKDMRAFLGLPDEEKRFHSSSKNFSRPSGPSGNAIYGRALDYLTKRGLTPETLKENGIRSTDDAIIFPFRLPDGTLVMEKTLKIDRRNGKKETWVSREAEPILFGWPTLYPDARAVVICEGEIDQLTLWQLGVPALSVPFGAGSGAKHDWVEREWERLESFDEIILCFDKDEEGQKAVADLVPRLGRDRCRVVTLPAKDPNECLMKGLDMESAFASAAWCHPEGLKGASDYLPGAFEILRGLHQRDMGFVLPWCKNLSLRPSELTVWNGVNGHGKTTLLNHLTIEFLSRNIPVLYCSHEMIPERLLAQMVRQATGGDGHYSDERLNDLRHGLFSRLLIYTGKEDRMGALRYAIRRYGVQHIIVDNLTRLCRMDDYAGQQAIVQELADLKDEFSVHIHLVTHARKGESERGRPDKQDVRGAGPITDIADNVVTLHRNKEKSDKLSENPSEFVRRQYEALHDATLYVQKQRVDGWEGFVKIFFDPRSCQFSNAPASPPTIYDQALGFEEWDDSRKWSGD